MTSTPAAPAEFPAAFPPYGSTVTCDTSSAAADSVDADAVVVGVGRGPDGLVVLPGGEAVDEALGGRLGAVLGQLGATGRADETVRFATLGATTAPTVLAVGLGDVPAAPADGGAADPFDPEVLRRAAGTAVRALAGAGRVATTLALVNGAVADTAVAAVAEGSMLGAYAFDAYRARPSAGRPAPVEAVTLLVPAADEPLAAATIARSATVVASIGLVRDLVNTPPGDLPPARLAEIAAGEATAAGLGVSVLDEHALREGGFGGILGVGQGSVRPPRLVRIQWRPDGATRTVALVGKGITFDSGGLSLKPSVSMEWMKTDMTGAATVLGAILAAARLQLPVAVTAWMPLAENMPSGSAIRPSDVLTMYGGKKVEVLNTDAEGRLVLADAIARAAEEKPDLVVDVATLTGAQIVALGMRVSGVMGSDDGRDLVVAAAADAGEAVWPMPMPPELRRSLDSSVADLANVAGGGGRDGGMLVAAHFLAAFVPDGLPWAHVDIAGPSWNNAEPYGYVPKGATGVAVRTLVTLLEGFGAGGGGDSPA